jgi:N-acetylmuramoyl-L-alanine amidase
MEDIKLGEDYVMRLDVGAKALLSILLAFVLLISFFDLAVAQEFMSVCFWSVQGPVCVERPFAVMDAASAPEGLLAALLAGPTAEERAQGIWSAIPEGAALEELVFQPDGTVVVRLNVPWGALQALDHETFEVIVQQIGGTLDLAPSVYGGAGWRDLRIQTWDPSAGEFVPLADFLPRIPAPRKATIVAGEETQAHRLFQSSPSVTDVGQPPAAGQGQPQGALSGKTVYVSAGHGWQWNYYVSAWRTQRPPYPSSPYAAPIIEDHNNAEAVDQYLLHYLWNAGAQVWPVRERDMNEAGVIVDGDSPPSGAGYAETGVWATAVPTGTGYAGADYRYAATVTDTPTAAAVWTATLSADGRYAVYVWYRPGANRAPDAHYTVHHAGGETAVVVDQQHHGITWHYIGAYGFRGGEVATITLSNLSSLIGRVVVADAVRFGGGVFDDLSGIETDAPGPPDKAWWEVAAFYYTQRMGMDKPPDDVTARPIYARWEHAGTGDDAVYVSWHTNGASSGYQTSTRGTMSIIHNDEGNPITAGSEALRDAVHAELVQDIRAGWDPTWPEYKRSMNLGELRELWDDDPDYALPGTLIEVAYHDHPTDTDALKEPYFNMLAARAFYQGIVKYFEQRDGIDLIELPEPPTHLALQNVGGGQVRVSWQAPLTDTVGLVGDAAAGYRVYTSADGLGWSNGLAVTTTTACTLTGLQEGQLLFVRVAAANAGGESFPTEVLALRAGEGAGVLLVNGFDRLDRAMIVPETDPVEGYNMRMFLEQMNRYDYAVQHGEVISYPFDGASNEAVRDGLLSLDNYTVVDWVLGEESSQDETLDATERALLTDFLGGGGALFLSGAEVGWHLDYLEAAPSFYDAVLRADYAGDDAETYEVAPSPGSIFDGLGNVRFDAPGMYDADYPDLVTPVNGSAAALEYSGGLAGTAAVQYADGCERLVYLGFPFETVWPDQRPAVMGRVLDFLGVCLPAPVDTEITAPVDGSAHNAVPPFEGSATAGAAATLDRVETQIERDSDGWYWTGSGWVVGTTWLTATGTEAWSCTLPSLNDDVYHLRARAWTTGDAVDDSPAEVVFTYDTLPPASTTLITPTGGVVFLAPLSVTLMWAPVEPDGGSPLAYVVALDGQPYTTTQTAYTPTHVAGGWRTWGVQVFDAAGNRSAWVTDTFHYPSLDTRIVSPQDGSAHNGLPPFTGTVEAEQTVVLERVEVQIQRASDGRYWVTGTAGITGSAWITGPVWVTATTWVTATGAVSWTYQLPGLDDDDYALRARAWMTDGEVDLSPAEVVFTYDTLPPTSTVLITPTGGITLSAASKVALVWEPVEPDGGSALAYVAALDGRLYTTTQTVYTVTHLVGRLHTWGVQVFDAASNRSEWVTDTFWLDMHACWLPVILRNFGTSPESVLLNGGFETDEGWVLNQLAVYDTVRVHSGLRSARVGIPPGEPGSDAYSSVAQTFVVPSSGAVTLQLWVYPIGEGDDAGDYHYVSLRDEAGGYHALEHWQSDAQEWERRQYDLSPYLGQTVTLYIGTRNDGDDDTTALYVDDVVIEVGP